MYRSLLFLLLAISMIHGNESQQLQMPDDHAAALTVPLDSAAQLEALQRNVTALWAYIYELRGAVTHHLNHLRQHQVEMENAIHRMEHHGDGHGDTHAAHTTDHSHSGEDHSHGSSQHSHSGEDHHHSGEHHSHSGEHHSHGDDEHSHSSDQHSHSGEHQSHGHYHDSHSHSHSHTDGDHASGHEGGDQSHAHKDSHENDDLQQTSQVSEPLVEPVIVPTTRQSHSHHHHHSHGSHGGVSHSSTSHAGVSHSSTSHAGLSHSSTSHAGVSRSSASHAGVSRSSPSASGFEPLNVIGEDGHNHGHHSHGSSSSSMIRNRTRTVTMPKYSEYDLYEFAVCNVQANRAIPVEQQQNIVGQISLWQKKSGGPLNIHLRLSGFSMGDHHAHHQQVQQEEDNETPPMVHKHGFHIHSSGDLSNGCQSTGPHYNPKGVNHGGPNALVRHVGDLGNIECDDHGIANLVFTDGIASLKGPYSVVGKAMVIHSGQDDYGLGGDEESLRTGNAGTRLACCVIEKVEKLPIRSYKAMKTATQYQN